MSNDDFIKWLLEYKGGVQGESTFGAPLLGGEQPKVAPSVTAFGSYSKGALNLGFP